MPGPSAGRPTCAKKRVRAYAPKVTTGCLTCRIRRVKCDEAKPSCEKCLSSGRKCDGYRLEIQRRQNRCVALAHHGAHLSIDHHIDVDIDGTEQERSCFKYFRDCAGPQLSGVDSDFWDRFILQASHHEPAIRHAVNALGSLHRQFEFHDTSNLLSTGGYLESNGFALHQYGKAIDQLFQVLQNRSKEYTVVALITCVLFVCFEALRGHHRSALLHIEAGVKILAEVQSDYKSLQKPITLETMTPSYVPLSVLSLVFVRLSNHASQISSNRNRNALSSALNSTERGYQSHIPISFSSLDEAQNAFVYIWTASHHFPQSVSPPEDQTDQNLQPNIGLLKHILAIKLQQWSRAFESFLRCHPQSFDRLSQQSILAMKIHRILTGIFFDVGYVIDEVDETLWDSYYVEFEDILSHASSLLKLASQSSPRIALRTFHLGIGIILPLFFVAIKCRHPTIRRKALQLLNSTHRQEGLLNTVLIAKAIERLVTIEEKGLGEIRNAEDIPSFARLSDVSVEFHQDKQRIFVRYLGYHCQEVQERWILLDERYDNGHKV